MDRKEFFNEAFRAILGKGIEFLEKAGGSSKLEFLADSNNSASLKKQRPPGAVPDEALFLKNCTGCDSCMKACPVNIIMIEDLERRAPVIYPDKDPCIQCPGYPCISSCPTGALSRKYGFSLRLIS